MLCFTFAIVESNCNLCVTFLKFGEECSRNPIFCIFFSSHGVMGENRRYNSDPTVNFNHAQIGEA